MRKKIIGLFVLASFACVLLIPALSVGQQQFGQKGGPKGKKGQKGQGGPGDFGGFGGKQKGPRNGGAPNLDPAAIFNMMSRGTDSIIIANSGMLQMPLQNWAFQNGNTSGVVSREEFGSFMMTYMQGAGFAGFGGGMGGGFGKGGGAGSFDTDQMATQRFMKLDKNSDGFLNEDEIPNNVKAIWRQYDTNGDGLLDLEEYKVLFNDVTSGGNAGKSGLGALGAVIEEEWDQRPTVFRAGKLPKELPSWFEYCDKKGDGDGQVALWEWRQNSGKSIAEFQVMDRNGDGLLTAEEVLAYEKAQMGISGSLTDGSMVAKNMKGFGPGMQGNNGGKKGKGGPGGGKGGPGGGKGGGKGGKGGKGGGGGGFGGGNNPWGGGD